MLAQLRFWEDVYIFFFSKDCLSHCFGMQFILKLFAMNLLLFYFIIQGGGTDSEYLCF